MKTDLVPAESVVDLQRAEIDTEIATAKAYPRDVARAMSSIRSYIQGSKSVAQECIYTKPVGKGDDGRMKHVDGPSIRFAELLLSEWTNIRFGTRLVAEDARSVTVEAVVYDTERNVRASEEITRPIVGKSGRKYPPQVIENTIRGAQSIALRGATFRVIPPALWSECYELARDRIAASDEPPAVRWEKAKKWFGEKGFSKDWLLGALSLTDEKDVCSDHFPLLEGLRNAVKDGSVKPEPEPEPKTRRSRKAPESYESVTFLEEATSLDDLNSRYDGTDQGQLENDERVAFAAAYETLAGKWEEA